MNFEDVKRAVDDNSIRLIDVRTPEELKKMGKIPTAVNLPRKSIDNLRLEPRDISA